MAKDAVVYELVVKPVPTARFSHEDPVFTCH
jgi:hypothetical protein